MKILSIDTSGKYLCLGLSEGDKSYEYSLELGRKLSGCLSPTISRVLQSLKIKPQDLDYLGCGLGPGSFTSLRIGLATVKAMSWALNKPVAGVSTLDIIASNVTKDNGHIVVAMDAKRDLIYTGIYSKTPAGLKRISPYMLLNEEDFTSTVKQKCFLKQKNQVIITGDAPVKRLAQAVWLDKDYWYPQPPNLIKLIKQQVQQKNFITAFKLNPIYLYPKECQIRK